MYFVGLRTFIRMCFTDWKTGMTQDYLFSILIPVYNAGSYLTDCLKSIDEQTFDSFEVVIVDDGSTDGSGEACDEWASSREWCRVVHTENRGLFLSRRTGFEHAAGEYCMPLDADDTLHPETLASIGRVVNEYNPDMIAFATSRHRDYSKGRNGIPIGYHQGDCLELRKAVCSGYANNLCGKAFKTSVIRNALSQFEPVEDSSYAEDWAQLLSVVDNALSCYSMTECLYWYRPNPGSTVHMFDPRHINGLNGAFVELDRCSKKWGPICRNEAKNSKVSHSYGLLTILYSAEDGSNVCYEDALRDALERWGIEEMAPSTFGGKIKKKLLTEFMQGRVEVVRLSVAVRRALLKLFHGKI